MATNPMSSQFWGNIICSLEFESQFLKKLNQIWREDRDIFRLKKKASHIFCKEAMENTFSQNKKLNGRHDIGSRKEDLWQKEKSHNDIFAESSQSVQFSSVAQSCPTLCDPMNRSTPGLLSITNSQSSLKLTSIKSVMPSSHFILCRPLLLLPPIPPSMSLFQWINYLHEVAKVLEFQL